ncbi:hypothetical protein [Serratia marcescens]|uniref:hypothetical protein n=1 Tax=Serratia marcescens TaxID=615 RepID=UPI0007C97E26|nr:hypothetical protein [Serratia marcescens]OAH29142.1 hypothetical protein AYJ10_05840 [Serratia marcescens]
MKITLKYSIDKKHEDLIVSDSPIVIDIPASENVDFNTTMTFAGDQITIEREVSYSEETIKILEAADKDIDKSIERGEYLTKWYDLVYTSNAKDEISSSMREFYPLAQNLVNEAFTCLNANLPFVDDGVKIYVTDDHSNVIEIEPPIHLNISRGITLTISEENINEIFKNYNKNGETLYAFKVLNKSRQQEDLNLRVAEIAVAAELGIKEFYCKKIPALMVILTSIQSPPIADLYGKIFKSYFHDEFPNKNKIKKLIERRNKIVHSHSALEINHNEVSVFDEMVQESLSILQELLIGKHAFLDNKCEFVQCQKTKTNAARLTFSEKQKDLLHRKQCVGKFRGTNYISFEDS